MCMCVCVCECVCLCVCECVSVCACVSAHVLPPPSFSLWVRICGVLRLCEPRRPLARRGWMEASSGSIQNVLRLPITLSEPYGGRAPLQVVGASVTMPAWRLALHQAFSLGSSRRRLFPNDNGVGGRP